MAAPRVETRNWSTTGMRPTRHQQCATVAIGKGVHLQELSYQPEPFGARL
jgi:hypothetical protein